MSLLTLLWYRIRIIRVYSRSYTTFSLNLVPGRKSRENNDEKSCHVKTELPLFSAFFRVYINFPSDENFDKEYVVFIYIK